MYVTKKNPKVKVLKVNKGFEVGVLGNLFTTPIKNIKELANKFDYKNKRIFKKEGNKKLFSKALEKSGLSNSEDVMNKLKDNGCEHYVLFDKKRW